MRHQKRNKLHELTEMDKAYLAGLFDGEGCVHISRYQGKNNRSPTFTLHVMVSQCDENYLIYWMGKTGMGKIYIHHPQKKEHRPGYCWTLPSRSAAQFLETLLPLLMVKKEQAEIAIEFQKSYDQYIGGSGYIVPRELIEHRESLRLLLKDKKKESMPDDDEAIFETLQEIKSRQTILQLSLLP